MKKITATEIGNELHTVIMNNYMVREQETCPLIGSMFIKILDDSILNPFECPLSENSHQEQCIGIYMLDDSMCSLFNLSELNNVINDFELKYMDYFHLRSVIHKSKLYFTIDIFHDKEYKELLIDIS